MKFGDLKVGMKFRWHKTSEIHEVVEIRKTRNWVDSKWRHPGGDIYREKSPADRIFHTEYWIPVYVVEGFEV